MRLNQLPLISAAALVALLSACGSSPSPTAVASTASSASAASAPARPSSAVSASASAASGQAKPAASGSAAGQPQVPAGSRASQAPAVSSSASGPAQAASWLTYHGNAARTGIGPDQPTIAAPKQLWATQLDGAIYGEPLVAGGNVYVVTENDTAYSLSVADGKVAWQQHVGEPVPRSALPCGNIDPSGFTATPVIDAAKGTLYAAGRMQPTHHELFAFDLTSGAVKFHRTVDPAGADPRYLQVRSALLLENGRVYVSFGGNFGDCGAYKGAVVSAPGDGAAGDLQSYQVPTEREGAIWAPPGPTQDQNGDLLIAVGNAASASKFDYGNAVVRLSPDLKEKDYWAPADWAALSQRDTDVGSISPTIVQDGQVFQSGKNGTGYLLRASKLGNIGGEIHKGPICRAAFGGTAYQPPVVYLPCTDGLVAVNVGNGSFQTAWHAAVQASNAPPIVAYGSVWQVDGGGALLQIDPTNGQLRNRATLPTPVTAHFLTPSAAGGKLFVTSGKTVLAFS